jgi:fructose-1,6-bisphosphatase/inositol monophosphatase family enzyme
MAICATLQDLGKPSDVGPGNTRCQVTGTGLLWTLNPIDGTSNFAHAIPLCAVSPALLHDGRPVLGVIDAPFLGEEVCPWP